MAPQTPDSYLAASYDRHLASLKELLAIPSVSADPERGQDMEACAAWLQDHLRQIGVENVTLLRAGGNPVVYGDWLHAGPEAPTLLVYGHYDVQPPEPLELWDSPPFEATIRDGRLYARGVSDNKGQFYLYLKAFEACLATEGGLPLNVKFILEGEEELRADHLAALLAREAVRLHADVAAVTDSGFFSAEHPGISTGLRGMAALNFTLSAANTDLHSGGFGGTVPNAAQAMATLLAGLRHPEDGRVLVPGFYEDVRPLPAEVRAAWSSLPFSEQEFAQELGLSTLYGEKDFTPLERMWARPTLEVCGLWGGYQGDGVKTVIPSQAHAKISCRLVPDQDPTRVLALLRAHLEANKPAGTSLHFDYELPGCYPVLTQEDSPALQAGLAALTEVYGREALVFRNGGSVPVVELIQRTLGLDSVLLGFACPDENFHAPNEFIRLDNFRRGSQTVVRFWRNLRRAAL